MYNYYSLSEKIKNFVALLYTKFFWKNSRLIRLPFYCRNKKNISLGSNLTTGYGLRIEAANTHRSIFIGDDVTIGDYCHIAAHSNVYIGNNVLIASRVFISDTSHGIYHGEVQSVPYEPPNERKLYYSSVSIGNNVWIGENVSILPGACVGDNCIIGANSVVTKTFDNDLIIVGVPAKAIKKYNRITKKWEAIK